MPIHDWTKVDAGTCHDMHHAWIAEIRTALNGGILPPELYAQAERRIGDYRADVLALQRQSTTPREGGVAVAEVKPSASVVNYSTGDAYYLRMQSRVAIRNASGHRLVGLIEIVSPGNKDGRGATNDFIDKCADLVNSGCHLSIVELFSARKHDPQGLVGEILDRLGTAYDPPGDRPLATAGIDAGDERIAAYIEPLRVGATLPEMPLFFAPGRYVNVPLESTYTRAFSGVPAYWRDVIEA